MITYLSTQIWRSLYFPPLAFFVPLLCTATYLIFILIANLYVSNTWIPWSYCWKGEACLNYKHGPLCQYCTERALEENEATSKHREVDQVNGKPLEQTIYTTVEEKKSLALPHICKGGFFADHFENLANFWAHYDGTGLEIWQQMGWNRCICHSCRHRMDSGWSFQVSPDQFIFPPII